MTVPALLGATSPLTLMRATKLALQVTLALTELRSSRAALPMHGPPPLQPVKRKLGLAVALSVTVEPSSTVQRAPLQAALREPDVALT